MSQRDPLGLFPDQQPLQPRSENGGMGWAVVGVLLGVALLLGYQRLDGDWWRGDGGGDQQDQRDDERCDDGKPVEAKGYLIFVHERKPLSPTEADMLDTAKEFCASHPGLECRSVDDDDDTPEVKKIILFAASKGVQWSAHNRNQIMLMTAKKDAIKYGGTVLTYIEQEGAGDGKTIVDQLIVMLSQFPVYRDIVSDGARWQTSGNVRIPGDAKIRRCQSFAAQSEAGNVRLVDATWNSDYCDELTLFPEYAYADQVDASSGAYNVLQRIAPSYGDLTATRSTEVAPQSRYGHTAAHSDGNSISRWEDLPWNQHQDNSDG